VNEGSVRSLVDGLVMTTKPLMILSVVLLGALASVFSIPKSSGAPTITWNQTYGGSDTDQAMIAIQTDDAGYLIAGRTSSFCVYPDYDNFWLVKVNASGNMQWNKTYGGIDREEAYSLVQTDDGGYVIAGFTGSYGAGEDDAWLVKIDALGDVQWNKTYGGLNNDYAHSVIKTEDGGFAVIGFTSFSNWEDRYYDVWLIKTDALGNMQWNKTYGGTGYDEGYSIVQTSDGGYALGGSTASFGSDGNNYWLIKVDDLGVVQWNRTYGGAGDDRAYSMVQAGDGGFAIGGVTGSFGAGDLDFWLVRTDSSGNAQWNKTYGGTDFDHAYSLVQTADGGYAMTGVTQSFGISGDIWLVKTDSSGVMQWNRTYGGIRYDWANSLIQTADGGYAIAGSAESFFTWSGGDDFWLVKTDENGVVDIVKLFVSMTLNSSSVVSGGQVSVTAHVTSETSAIEGALVQFGSDKGTFSLASGLTSSLGDVATAFIAPTVTEQTEVRITTIVSKTGCYSAIISQYVSVLPLGAPTLSVEVAANPRAIQSGQTSTVIVQVNASFGPIADAFVALSSDKSGTLLPESGYTNSSGYLTSTYTAPAVTTQTPITIKANATKNGYLIGQGQTQITVQPATLSVTVTLEPTTIQSSQTSTITTKVTYDGNPMSGATVTLSSDKGGTLSATSGSTDSNGYFAAVFTAPTFTAQTTVTITATANKTGYVSAQSQKQITVSPVQPQPQPEPQQPDLTLWIYVGIAIGVLIALGAGFAIVRRGKSPA